MIKVNGNVGCGGIIIVLILNAMVGGFAVDFILSWFGKFIPFYGDIILGLFLGEFAIPIAMIGWVCKLFGLF